MHSSRRADIRIFSSCSLCFTIRSGNRSLTNTNMGAGRKKNSECDQRLWKIYLPGIDFHALSAYCIFLSAQTRSAGGFNYVFFVDPPCFSLYSRWFPEEDREKTWRIQGKGCCFSVPVNLVFPFPAGWLKKIFFRASDRTLNFSFSCLHICGGIF